MYIFFSIQNNVNKMNNFGADLFHVSVNLAEGKLAISELLPFVIYIGQKASTGHIESGIFFSLLSS